MANTGRCYCGEIQYESDGDAVMKGQCHCRECQYISGGSPNVCIGVPEASFSYTKGTPKGFKRSDLDNPVTRDFCENCGTHIAARTQGMMVLKVGTLDNPADFEGPQMVIYTVDKQPFHHIPDGIPSFERTPG